MTADYPDSQTERLARLLAHTSPEDVAEAVKGLPSAALASLFGRTASSGLVLPPDPASQAVQLDPTYVVRPHIAYLSRRLAQAVSDVERGQSRRLLVSMPPRMGKSTLVTMYLIVWLLRKHPDWPYMLTSHDGGLATAWGRTIQRVVIDNPALGVSLARYPSAASEWETTQGGSVLSRGIRGSITGRGARVLVIDDPVKDFVDAHSALVRESTWNWWLMTSQPRLEPPFLVLVVMTRWHEDDFAGRIMSPEHEGDPDEWEVIRLPALADSPTDVLGRPMDAPLLSPLLPDEDEGRAYDRWQDTRRSVGSYAFASMHQQRPAPAKGAIFDSSWWRFWTTDPSKVTDDGRVVLLDPATVVGGQWVDSWDCAFKAVGDSDFVVGQRWVRVAANRFLVVQQRGRWSFTQTLAQMKAWATADPLLSPYGRYVHRRLIEDSANGPAILDTLQGEVSGLVPLTKHHSKEAYARAVTPEVESGNVYLPHPSDPGNGWVTDLLSELRNFPHDAHDDQVDALTQALADLRTGGVGSVTVPGRLVTAVPRDLTRAANSDLSRGGRRYG